MGSDGSRLRPPRARARRLVALKPYGSAEWERAALSELLEVRHTVCATEGELIAAVPGVHLLLVDVDVPVTGPVIDAADRLRAVVCLSTGVDFVDLAEATRRGVVVTHLPDYAVQAVAEHTFALLFALQRRVVVGDRAVRDGRWEARQAFGGVELAGKTLGIVGLGRIGLRVAEIGRVLGMRPIAFSPRASAPPKARAGRAREVERCGSLDDLLRASDVVTIHTSLRPETRGLVGRGELALMRPHAVLINVSRGAIVDQAALADALRARRIGGAALDVLVTEPPAAGDPLLEAENVVLTPHIAWFTAEARERARQTVREQVRALVAGQSPPHVVNTEVLGSAGSLLTG